jgi:hypothetical protein
MILRPISLLTFTAAALAGLHLYQTKHEVALLDRELRGIAKAIEEAKDRTQALQAEWAWLNEPERLRGVAQRHLQLEPMQPAQFIRLNEAERRLPAVVAYDGPTALFAERTTVAPEGPVQFALLPRVPEPVQVAVLPRVQEPAPATRGVAEPPAAPVALPLPPPAPPREEAQPAAEPAAPRPAAPPVVVARPVEPQRQAEPPARHVEPRPAPVELARVAPPRHVAPAPRPALRQAPDVAALPPVAAPVRPAVAQVAPRAPALAQVAPRPPVPAVRPAVTQVTTAAAPRIAESPAVSLGSALGGGRPMLAPPVPFGSAHASTLNGAGVR